MGAVAARYRTVQNRGLGRQELIDLAVRAKTDQQALEELTNEMWPIILQACAWAVKRYPEHHLEVGELIPFAWDGLCRCVQTYDPQGGASFSMWCKRGVAYRVASRIRNIRRKHLPHLWSQSRSLTGVVNMVPDESFGEGPAHQDERLVVGGEAWHAVQFNILLLPPRWQTALRLRYEEGLLFAEIGVALGTSTSRAQQIVANAIGQLRQLVGEVGRG